MIPNLCGGGAERVLVNLCNELSNKHDITIMSIFDEGENKDRINSKVQYKYIFRKKIPGLRIILKFISLKSLINIDDLRDYNVIISFLEGVSTKIVGELECDCKKIAWIHSRITYDDIFKVYRNKEEFINTYLCYDYIISVSNDVKNNFLSYIPDLKNKMKVIHNINNINAIKQMSNQSIDIHINEKYINAVVIGKITNSKGVKRLIDVYIENVLLFSKLRIYFIGEGSELNKMQLLIDKHNLSNNIFFLGYKKNPYVYLKYMDFLICPSYTEGLSTTVTEAMILGKAVLVTDCGGMHELLGENEYGYIVENSDEGLKTGLISFVNNRNLINFYAEKSQIRGRDFYTDKIIDSINKIINTL